MSVTWGDWNVSCMTGSGVDGAKLSVFNVKHGWSHMMRGFGDGKLFLSTEDAWKWALEHGYLQTWFKGGWCSLCRRQHKWCHTRTGDCTEARGGHYDGCREAQARWDAEDWTRRMVACPSCWKNWWQYSYMLADPGYDWERVRMCPACLIAEDRKQREVAYA